jgi:hypothetical protein
MICKHCGQEIKLVTVWHHIKSGSQFCCDASGFLSLSRTDTRCAKPAEPEPPKITWNPENCYHSDLAERGNQPQASSFAEMEVRATVALDGDTLRACNNESCSKDYQHEGECTTSSKDGVAADSILRFAIEHDTVSDLIWREEDGNIHAAVICSDCFWWGTADAEELTPETFPIYKQAVAECEALAKTLPKDSNQMPQLYADELFAARIRKMRPQVASYEMYPPVLWPLFDACGPERETGLGNPAKQPTEWNGPKFIRQASLEELSARLREMREALAKYGTHMAGCLANPDECNCGFSVALMSGQKEKP